MEWMRYGFVHQVLVAVLTAGVALSCATIFGLSWSLPFYILTALLTASVIVLDLLTTGVRVIRDFKMGRFTAAARGTRFLMRLTSKPSRLAALNLNLAACRLAQGDYTGGGAFLQKVARSLLEPPLKGIWENNYAYYLLNTGGDPAEALRICDEALGLDSQNPAFHGTRGMALLSMGRLDDAIAELSRAMETTILGPASLAETYFYLGRAWELKGEEAYARDHFLKAVNVSPESPYGRKSSEMLKRYLKP